MKYAKISDARMAASQAPSHPAVDKDEDEPTKAKMKMAANEHSPLYDSTLVHLHVFIHNG